MTTISPHDWLRPRLNALVEEAASSGIARDISVAVITDLINGPGFASDAPALPDEGWARDIGEPTGQSSEMPPNPGLPPEEVFGREPIRPNVPNIRGGGRRF